MNGLDLGDHSFYPIPVERCNAILTGEPPVVTRGCKAARREPRPPRPSPSPGLALPLNPRRTSGLTNELRFHPLAGGDHQDCYVAQIEVAVAVEVGYLAPERPRAVDSRARTGEATDP